MQTSFSQELEERLLRYVQIDTQSDETSITSPSTAIQLDLLRLLRDELVALGIKDVVLTNYGAVLATLPANQAGTQAPIIAFLAHVDTAPAFHASGVKPIVHRQYNGEPIVLPDDPSQVLSPEQFPYLKEKIGDDIITASGTTLLGGDDKAGAAIIMTMAGHLLANPTLPHGELRLCFTADEEIGRGVHQRLPADLAAAFAYTLDGAELGEFVYESFSADKAVVKVTGVSTHPGAAKGKMVNALNLAAKILDALPQNARTPETTDERAGFINPYKMEGTSAQAEISFILRDFERDGLKAHGDLVQTICQAIQLGEPRAKIECTISAQYRNMRYWLEKDMRPVNLAQEAIEQAGIQPFTKPIRGGTDGSRLTEQGVPTPNLFTGMQNIHGPLEWISVQDMAQATQVCLNLVQLWAKEQKG